ncbi:hypothetical protein, partial [Streptomyces sp. NRRL S-474]|uniref:hypothetical protein n=1 Tax=Streptomyces sp. NRRL S-474 TaxID=1463909 RepID=UPI001F2AAEE0
LGGGTPPRRAAHPPRPRTNAERLPTAGFRKAPPSNGAEHLETPVGPAGPRYFSAPAVSPCTTCRWKMT